MFDFNVVLLDLENSDIAAVSFEGTKTNKQKFRGVLDSSNLMSSVEENFKLEGSRTPQEINILFSFLQN